MSQKKLLILDKIIVVPDKHNESNVINRLREIIAKLHA